LKKRVKVATEKIAILGCVHTPYQDRAVMDSTFDFLKFWKPDRVILNGDIHDIYALSKHRRDPQKRLCLQDEIDEGRKFHYDLRRTCPNSEIEFNMGNHEARWMAFLNDEKPELSKVDDFQFEKVFRLEENGVTFNRGVDGRYARIVVGEVLVGHFEVLRKHSGDTAKAIVSNLFSSVVAHHSHRMGTYEKRTPRGRFLGQEGGCLCSLDTEWIESPDWSQGFVVMQKVVGKDRYHIDPIRVVGGDILYDGYLY
jgi:hypothetical protein